MLETKRCTKCNKVKSLIEFNKDARGKNGHCSQCRLCRKAYNEVHKEKFASYGLENLYGITLEDKRKIWKKQDGKCAICRKKLIESKDCCVDHCHTTNKIRGLLCDKCNRGLGNFNDDPVNLRRAANYLEV